MSVEAPPSYEEVVRDLNDKLKNATPKDVKYVHDVLQALPASHQKVLLEHQGETPSLTPEQEVKMGIAMIDAVDTQFVAEQVQLSAVNATKAIKSVEESFSKLLQKLSGIDSKYPNEKPAEGAFVPRLIAVQDVFRKIVQDSRALAVDIAVYGQSFDEVMAPLTRDSSVPKDERLNILKQFIKDAEKYKIQSGDINARYQSLITKMNVFVGTFSSWSLVREGKIDKEIEQIDKDILALQNEIKDKRIAMIALGGIAMGALPVTGVIAAMSGPAAPAVMIVGAIIAGVTAITAVALAAAITSLNNRLDAKKQEKKDKEKEKRDLKAARDDLVTLGQATLVQFKLDIDVLAAFWLSAEADAKACQKWLEDGEKFINIPKYLKTQTDHAVNIYQAMAKYLTAYAKGIDDSGVLDPPKS